MGWLADCLTSYFNHSLPVLEQSRWLWSLAGSNPDNQLLAIKLAEHLVDSEFQASWTQVAGYIPTRPNALEPWPDKDLQVLLDEIIQSAQLIPSNDLVNKLGPVLQEATLSILKEQTLIADTAQVAADSLK